MTCLSMPLTEQWYRTVAIAVAAAAAAAVGDGAGAGDGNGDGDGTFRVFAWCFCRAAVAIIVGVVVAVENYLVLTERFCLLYDSLHAIQTLILMCSRYITTLPLLRLFRCRVFFIRFALFFFFSFFKIVCCVCHRCLILLLLPVGVYRVSRSCYYDSSHSLIQDEYQKLQNKLILVIVGNLYRSVREKFLCANL